MGKEVVEIHRSRQADNFTIVPNHIIRDVRLDRFTRSVLIEVLSNTADWHASADDMWDQAARARPEARGEGRDIYRRAFKQLEDAGYLIRTKVQGLGGKWITHLHFYDTPSTHPNGTDGAPPAAAPASTGDVSAGHADDCNPVPGPSRDDGVSAGHPGDCKSVPGSTCGKDVPAGESSDCNSDGTSWDSGEPAWDSVPGTQASTKRTKDEELRSPSVNAAEPVLFGAEPTYRRPPPKAAASARRPGKHAAADALAAEFWERHKTSTAQGFLAIRGVVRTAMANEIPRDELTDALDLLAREGRAISGGSVQTALKILRDRRDGHSQGGHQPYRNPGDQSAYDEEARPA